MAAPVFGKPGSTGFALLGLVLLGVASKVAMDYAFVMPARATAHSSSGMALRGSASVNQGSSSGVPIASSAVACGLAAAISAVAVGGLAGARKGARGSAAKQTPMRYTTQEIIPSLSWIPAGIKSKELTGGYLHVACLAGVDIVVGKTEGGKLFAVADKCPPTGTSLSIGPAEVIGQQIVDPQYGTRFDVYTGEPEGPWCPSPPVIGGFLGAFMGGPQCIAVFEIREAMFSGEVEVLVDVNTRKAYEANYWKGLLDAQGKNDGTYY